MAMVLSFTPAALATLAYFGSFFVPPTGHCAERRCKKMGFR